MSCLDGDCYECHIRVIIVTVQKQTTLSTSKPPYYPPLKMSYFQVITVHLLTTGADDQAQIIA